MLQLEYAQFLDRKTQLGRRGVGIELKASYYQQAVRNIEDTLAVNDDQLGLALDDERVDPNSVALAVGEQP